MIAGDAGTFENVTGQSPELACFDNSHNIKSDRISDCDGRTMLLKGWGVKEQFEE
jgi:hypothetical protein